MNEKNWMSFDFVDCVEPENHAKTQDLKITKKYVKFFPRQYTGARERMK